jgi:alanine-glyoxylate transaminase/(R)-3-amino-2-methylpropionate-pyruvate transaminase
MAWPRYPGCNLCTCGDRSTYTWSNEWLQRGIELVKGGRVKEPAGEECAQVLERSKELGLLIGKGGFYGNVLRIKPPMCITRADVDFMLEALDIVFAEL